MHLTYYLALDGVNDCKTGNELFPTTLNHNRQHAVDIMMTILVVRVVVCSKMDDSIIHALHCGSEFLPYPKDGPVEWARGKPYIMGATAEFLVQKFGFTREQQDEVALRSNNCAEEATTSGKFKEEIVGVEVVQGKGKPPVVIDKDEHFRAGLKMADLAKLQPVFIPKTGTVTAGNSSGINDGAAAVLLMSEEKARSLGLKPLGYIGGIGIGACLPEYMGLSPVSSVTDLFRRTGRSVADYQRVEVNEVGCMLVGWLAGRCRFLLQLNRLTNARRLGFRCTIFGSRTVARARSKDHER
jgi:acetyl-CoA acetyltransferase